jgi:polysaccharide export outer membrane protein
MVLQEYRLGPGDQLRISVFGEPNLSGEFLVSPSGSISYPLVGEVPAQGKTVNEFSAALADVLRNGYVRQPNISVEVASYRPFFILGEVGAPGTYPYAAGLTVMNAVATAGGFTYRADLRRVYIKHAEEAGERLYELTSTTPIMPGDTVRIPERRF